MIMLKENSQIKIHMYDSQNEEININQDIYILKSKDGQLGFENENKKEFTTLSSFDSRVEFADLSNNNIYYYSHTMLSLENTQLCSQFQTPYQSFFPIYIQSGMFHIYNFYWNLYLLQSQ